MRYEEEGRWELASEGIREVESLSEAVRLVEVGEGGRTQKEDFLRAVGIK